MASCIPNQGPRPHAEKPDAGFATALAMAVSLSIAIGVSALLVRDQIDLIAARHALERTQAEYQIGAIQQMAALALRGDPSTPSPMRLTSDGHVVSVRIQQEASKLLPSFADALPEAWLRALRVADPGLMKVRIKAASISRPLTLRSLSELDQGPSWKACAADALSENGSPAGAAGQAQSGRLAPASPPITVRLTASDAVGWTDDRVVRLTNDQANPVILLDRRFYRQSAGAPSCPEVPRPKVAT